MSESGAIKAVLFDMDGVILDTERIHIEGWKTVCGNAGISVDEDFLVKLRGANQEYQKKVFQEAFGEAVPFDMLRRQRRDYSMARFEADGVAAKPGYSELTAWLREQEIPYALCTSTEMETAARLLSLAGLPCDFAATVTGMEPAHSKPAPDVFLLAAEKLGVRPEDCVVMEDSPNGVQAGCAAGCRVVMVPDTVPADEILRGKVTAVCGSLLEARALLITIQGFD